MKVMWITFAPIGRAAEILYGAPTQSGGWVDAAFESIKPYIKDKLLELTVVALDSKDTCVKDDETGVVYRTVNIPRLRGKRYGAEYEDRWKKLISEISPDIIQVWGTEFTFGLDVIKAAGDIPVCFYIQGVMESLVRHPLGDIPQGKLFLQLGVTSALKFHSLRKWHKINKNHVTLEGEMICKSAGLILDNEWTKAQYNGYTNKFYNVPLGANEAFLNKKWKVDECENHTLFTVAGGSCPQKGVHDAVLAVAKLKEKYPDIKLYIPGGISSKKPEFLYDSIFIRHIRKIIKENKLAENVVFTGRLSAEEMAQQMLSANAFIMPSCVETHSSSLREAMFVGTPPISADVGSVPEFVRHSKNGFIYRYGEVETLAHYIDKIFSDTDLAQNLSDAARETVRELYPQEKVGEMLMECYKKITNGGKNE